MKPIFNFGVAGIVGYIVDVTVLLSINPFLGPHTARLISFCAAIVTTWLINRKFTFIVNDHFNILHEFARYFITSIGGGALNIIVYSLLVSIFNLPTILLPVAVGAGALSGMLANYFLAKKYIYFKTKEAINVESQK